MKPILLALTISAFSLILWPAANALAQEDKVARGVITDIGGASITLEVRGEPLQLSVDKQTHVQVSGGSSKTRQATVTGKSGPHLADLLKRGQSVAVTYHEMAGDRRAALVRVIPSAGPAGGSVNTTSVMRSAGVVQAVGADSVTIRGNSGGGATFTQTFVIGPRTAVVGKGASTATASSGGRAPFNQLIAPGDHVSIGYKQDGSALRASDVRVTTKGSVSH